MAAHRLLLTVLCFSAVLCLVHANPRAKNTQQGVTQLCYGFSVNDASFQQVFKLLLVDNDRVLIGSTESLYVLDPNLELMQSIQLPLSNTERLSCEANFPQEKDFRCKNYITYAHQLNPTSARVCGTYGSLNPRCYTCQYDGTGCDSGYTTQFMQRTPTENVTVTVTVAVDYYYLGGLESYTSPDKILAKVFVNVAGDVTSADPETDNNQENIFKEPTNFVGSIERGAFIYFFYRETAIEYETMGQIIYSRVSRVCKNDAGGVTNPLNDEFTTFLKTRLMCSVGTNFPFIFNEIQDVVQSPSDEDFIYGLFTTSSAGSSSTAICRYNMTEIDVLFNEDNRRGQLSATHLWQSVDKEAEDTSARRSCSVPFRFQEYNHLEEYTLLNTNAPNCGLGETCSDYSRQTDEALAVFEGIRGQQLAVFSESSNSIRVYVGTNDNTIYEASISASEVLITEQIEIQPDVCATEPEIANKWPFGVSYLVATGGYIYGTLDNFAFRFTPDDIRECPDDTPDYLICPKNCTSKSSILDRSPDVSNFTFPNNIIDARIQIFKLFEGPDGSEIEATFSGWETNKCSQKLFKSTGAGKREFLHVLCEINGSLSNDINGVITVSSPMDCICDLQVNVTVVIDDTDMAPCDVNEVNKYDKEMAMYRYEFRKWLSNSVNCTNGGKDTCPAASSPEC